MKTPRYLMAMLIAAPVSVCFAQGGAQEGPGGSRMRPGGPGFEGGMMRMNAAASAIDTDHDGTLSASEIANAPKALLSLDKNGDGKVTADEVQAPFGPRPEGRPGGEQSSPSNADQMVATLMAFDKNGDGKLSKDELPERMTGIFARGDANHDGFLTKDEIRVLAEAQNTPAGSSNDGPRGGPPGRGPGQRNPILNDPFLRALDSDHDGVISAEEIRNASSALLTLDKNGDGRLTSDELRPTPRERQ